MAAADPTVELLTALNRALSEGRITPDEYGKRAKMLSAVKAQREEDRRHSKEIFDRYDTDHSGALDPQEFASLVLTLGANMSKEEIDAAFKSLDKGMLVLVNDTLIHRADGGGSVDFEEFYAWWSTPEVHSAKPSKLSTLRMTLTTQHLKEKSNAAAKKLNEALAANSGKKGEDDTQTINLSVSVGEFEKGSGLHITYENNEQAADTLMKEFGAAENDVVLSVAFTAVPDKEAFDLGVLSGKIRDLIALQEEIKFKSVKNDVKTFDGVVCFRVNLVVDGSEKVIADTVSTITSNLIKHADISIEFNEKLGHAFNKELQARLSLGLKLAAGGGATILELISSGGKIKKGKGKKKAKSEAAIPAILASRMREANFKIKTDTLQEAIALVVGSPAPFNNVAALRPLATDLVSDLPWSEMPDTVIDTYKIAVENLLGLHSVTIVANKAVLSIKAESCDVVKLLPSHDALQAAIKIKAGDDGSGSEGGDEPEDGEEKESIEASGAADKTVRWLTSPNHGSPDGFEPLRASFVNEDLNQMSMVLSNGLRKVQDASSPFGEVMEMVSVRESIEVAAKLVVKDLQEGKSYQPVVRLRAARGARIDKLVLEFTLSGNGDSESITVPFTKLGLHCDGAYYIAPLGSQELRYSGSCLSFMSAMGDTVVCTLKNPDGDLANGLKLDYLALYVMDSNTPAPAAAVPKAEAADADVERPICKNSHPMVWATGGPYNCDLCMLAHKKNFHWQCRPCDYDSCIQCFDKKGKKGSTHPEP